MDGQFQRRDLLESCIIECFTKSPAYPRDSLFRTEGTADFRTFYSHAMLSNIRASGRLHNSVVIRFLVDLTIHVVQESYSGMLHWVL